MYFLKELLRTFIWKNDYKPTPNLIFKTFHFSATCACPEIVYANFLNQPPFVVTNPRNTSDVTGFFPELMTKILMEVCVHCDAYRPTIYYDRTGLGYPSKKINMAKVKEGVDEGTHLNFPFFGRFEIEKYEGFYPYIGIVYSQGVAMIVKDIKVKNLGMVNILLAISKAWSVLFVGVLMSAICGWVFWFTVRLFVFIFSFDSPCYMCR